MIDRNVCRPVGASCFSYRFRFQGVALRYHILPLRGRASLYCSNFGWAEVLNCACSLQARLGEGLCSDRVPTSAGPRFCIVHTRFRLGLAKIYALIVFQPRLGRGFKKSHERREVLNATVQPLQERLGSRIQDIQTHSHGQAPHCAKPKIVLPEIVLPPLAKFALKFCRGRATMRCSQFKRTALSNVIPQRRDLPSCSERS